MADSKFQRERISRLTPIEFRDAVQLVLRLRMEMEGSSEVETEKATDQALNKSHPRAKRKKMILKAASLLGVDRPDFRTGLRRCQLMATAFEGFRIALRERERDVRPDSRALRSLEKLGSRLDAIVRKYGWFTETGKNGENEPVHIFDRLNVTHGLRDEWDQFRANLGRGTDMLVQAAKPSPEEVQAKIKAVYDVFPVGASRLGIATVLATYIAIRERKKLTGEKLSIFARQLMDRYRDASQEKRKNAPKPL